MSDSLEDKMLTSEETKETQRRIRLIKCVKPSRQTKSDIKIQQMSSRSRQTNAKHMNVVCGRTFELVHLFSRIRCQFSHRIFLYKSSFHSKLLSNWIHFRWSRSTWNIVNLSNGKQKGTYACVWLWNIVFWVKTLDLFTFHNFDCLFYYLDLKTFVT